jgi:hypothetical protein
MTASGAAMILWVLLFIFLLITAIAGFRPSLVVMVLLVVYVVIFQLGSRIRKR